ncbi:tRNA (N(6)-L-threonylcarbamoyladenosine(37)-C(2))-methylthiotransferase MtaB [Rhodocaloribacter litoris]|nr:tRNA (N(6)-L-threonylcarbamoyladenosine(37)-C(2))-methylthiotransferase MtaB [Rhodocaloribacter litoris]
MDDGFSGRSTRAGQGLKRTTSRFVHVGLPGEFFLPVPPVKVSFYTLGCKLNYAETSTLARTFEAHDFEVTPFGSPADVTVINTCTVTEEAERKCRQVIRRARRASPGAFIIVTGCYAQLRPGEIAALPGVDAVLGAREKFRIFDILDDFSKREQTQVAVSCIDDVTDFGPAYSSGERTRAFLKVQDGCDYSCSFCTIPLARGRSRSHPLEPTIAQAREIAARGYKEIVLSGVNIGLYGQEHGLTLLDLLRALDAVEGIERYRISSIEPNLLSDEIIDFVAASEKFQPHFHIPLQSGDDFVLGKMRRRYRRALYAERVARIRDRMPHACIGVDVIVGFPAETAERFENTWHFLDALPVSYLHVFTYSERPHTAAVDHPDRAGGTPVPKPERARRNRRLRLLSEKKRQAFYREHIGTVRPVLWEGDNRDGWMHGFTDNYIRVRRPYDPAFEGRIEPVRLGAPAPDGTLEAETAGVDGEAAFVPLG